MPDQEKNEALRKCALACGFDVMRVVSPDAAAGLDERLSTFLAQGHHGDMSWMETTAARRASPSVLWPDVRSIIMLGMNYGPDHDPLELLARRTQGLISCYALGRDYHDVVKKALKQIARRLVADTGAEVKVFVDTAPVMEKPLATSAGIGWQGKHTNLVSRDFGSWLFLGSIFTTLDLAPDAPETDHCGNCRRCLDICPTNAFPAPYQLDARRCISYLTIEHKGSIPRDFRSAIGNRIYGCDDCLAVCPWNKFAREAREIRFHRRAETFMPSLAELLELDDATFRSRFSGSPVKRIGRDRFIRNVLIAAGNSGDERLARALEGMLQEAAPVIRGAAVWALHRLLPQSAFTMLKAKHMPAETDEDVLAEWRHGALEIK